MEDKLKFLISYDHYINYVHNYSHDWSNFKKSNYYGYSTHYKSHITALEKFTESKFDSGFITWFTELFLKYIHFKSSDPYSDSDMLVYKSTSIVSAFTQQNFNLHESLGNFDSKTVDTLKDTLSQFQKRSVDNASEAKT